MEFVTQYIMEHSNGKKHPVCGSQIAKAYEVSGLEVRRLINVARCKGDPICSCSSGYYIASDRQEIQNTIDSLDSRIAAMSNARNGLQKSLSNDSFWREAV